MYKIIRSGERGKTDTNWLKSWHSFSFGDYFDYEKVNFGPLRVINDDIIAPRGGFPTHPHKNMEIITLVLSGALTHKDSTGNAESISYGEIQKMSAGSGILHSEFNDSSTEEVHLLQIWILPDRQNIQPGYQKVNFNLEEIKNKLFLAAGSDKESSTQIYQDAKLFYSVYEKGKEVSYKLPQGRGLYIHIISGKVLVENETLTEGDAIQISGQDSAALNFTEQSSFILFDLSLQN